MATVYFTKTDDSGDGSLRAALASASAGDTVAPDPSASWPNGVVIPLSSTLTFPSVIIEGTADQRIVLDGLGQVRFANQTASASPTFRYVDFKNGIQTGSTSPFYVTRLDEGDSITFERCRFYDNVGYYCGFFHAAQTAFKGSVSFDSCVSYGNTATRGTTYPSTVFAASAITGSISVSNCTFVGDMAAAIVSNGGTLTETNSLYSGLSGFDPSAAGFVDLTGKDFRLTASSPYLTGGATTGVDFLGHTRSGSIGAFDGSWLVVAASGSTTLASNTAVDYLEVGAGATVTFSGENRILAAKKGATIGAASFVAATDSTGYLATPTGTSTSSATLTGVKTATYGANVTAFSATCVEGTVSFSIAKTNAVAVLLEKQTGSTWTTVSTGATNSTTDTIAATTVYRTFDGATFKTATATVDGGGGGGDVSSFWRITPFAVLGGEPGGDDASFTATAWAVDPETYDD